MTALEFQKMLTELSGAWHEKRYDDAIAYFGDDIFYSDANNYSFSDKSKLRDFFNSETEDEQCEFHRSLFDPKRQEGVAEYTYSGTNQYHGTVWIILENDKIVGWREYQHKSDKHWSEFWSR